MSERQGKAGEHKLVVSDTLRVLTEKKEQMDFAYADTNEEASTRVKSGERKEQIDYVMCYKTRRIPAYNHYVFGRIMCC